MPYILLKRSDVPDSIFQTLGILPNESQRNPPYKPVGQTGYRNASPNPVPFLTSTVFTADSPGLTAYLVANVSSGAGAVATATITTVAVASLVNGDYFTISDGQQTVEFGFKVTAAYAVPATRVEVSVVGLVTADAVRDAIIAAVNASVLDVDATNGGAATVNLTNENQNQSTADQNNSGNSDNVANAGFIITDFAGATDSDSLTFAEASADSDDIRALFGYGVAGAAADMTKADINTALTTGSITNAQLSEVLDILAGRNDVVPSGADVEVAGEFVPGTGAFDDTAIPFRRLYNTESFRISYAEGQLSLARGSTFTYAGTTGAAVAVYADDGSLYTP